MPLGFIFDPVFHAIGLQLLEAPSLRGLWTSMYNTPLVPYTNFNNTVVLQRGGLAGARRADLLRRALGRCPLPATIGERVQRSKFYQAITASKAYNIYRLFRPESAWP